MIDSNWINKEKGFVSSALTKNTGRNRFDQISISKIIKYLSYILLALFLFLCVYFPQDTFGLKLPLIILMIGINFRLLCRNIFLKRYRLILAFGVIFPFICIMISIMTTGSFSNALRGGYAGFILVLVIIVKERKIAYAPMLKSMLLGLALLAIAVMILDIMGIFDVNGSPIRTFVYQYGMGLMGKSPTYTSYYKIFFKTSPLAIIVLEEAMYRKKWFWAIIVSLCLVISGTRANLIVMLMIVAFCLLYSKNRKNLGVKLCAGMLLILAVFKKALSIIVNIANKAGNVSSDQVRAGHIKGLVEYWCDNPLTLLTGSGFGSSFFSYGTNSYASSMEWSYLDFFRKIGLPLFLVFFVFLVIPIFSHKIRITKRIMYVGYLMISFTNPLLYSSTAYLMYIYMYIDIVADSARESVQ